MNRIWFSIGCMATVAISFSAQAEESLEPKKGEETWTDNQHQTVKTALHTWSNTIDSWLGTPDPARPASAGLRIMLDNEWNRYDKFSVKPRIRGKIRLPTLKKHLSLVFGDDELDNEARDKNRIGQNYREPLRNDKRYDRRQARHDNSSVGLRWSDSIKKLGIDADLDLGVRSGMDVYLRLKLNKEWIWNELFSTRLEQIYRYGSNSKYYLRTNFENKYQQTDDIFIANHLHLQYERDIDELITWGNSFYRQHNFSNFKRLDYGIYVGGNLNEKKFDINQYGPFISWRQPIWRKWLFIQPEVNFYNNREKDRQHTLGLFFRVEAVF